MITNYEGEIIRHDKTKDEASMYVKWNDETKKEDVIDYVTNIVGRYVNGHRTEVIISRIRKILDLADTSDIKDLAIKSSWDDEDEAEEWTEVSWSRDYEVASLLVYFSID